jgi:hypothetical protein
MFCLSQAQRRWVLLFILRKLGAIARKYENPHESFCFYKTNKAAGDNSQEDFR